jgi:uncharacterized membrane protein
MALSVVIDFFHLLATVAWVGGMIYVNLVLMPSLPAIEPAQRWKLVGAVTKRFLMISWGSVIMLAVTGIIKSLSEEVGQLSAATQLALKVKYGLFAVMLLIGILISVVLAPKMTALAPKPGEKPSSQFPKVQKQISTLSFINMILAVIILLCVVI